jgi:hypothetical protein
VERGLGHVGLHGGAVRCHALDRSVEHVVAGAGIEPVVGGE